MRQFCGILTLVSFKRKHFSMFGKRLKSDVLYYEQLPYIMCMYYIYASSLIRTVVDNAFSWEHFLVGALSFLRKSPEKSLLLRR